MGLEKMGLPPKPWEKGKEWTPDTPNCEGCQGAFTWINRKHHCRRCGGLFCNNCTLGRVYLRGQGDAPARVCDPCKQIEEAAKFERYSKTKAPRGSAKQRSKDDVADTLKHILKPEGKSARGDQSVDLESILASVAAAENDGDDDHELASPSEEHAAPVSPTRLHEEAHEERKRYTALKKQGKDAEALKAFKRAKELERQAEAREKEIRLHQRRASHIKTSPPSKEDHHHGSPGENLQKKRRTPSQDLGKEKAEKDDFLQELKALGWSEKEIREAENKSVVKTEEQLLAELAAEVRAKSEKTAATSSAAAAAAAPGPTDAMSMQITAHKRQALALKREGKLAEAKEELRKAKILEKQAEEMALLGGGEDEEASDDDEIQALIRKLEREEKSKAGSAGKGAISEDLGFDISFVGDDEDAHVEVDNDDLDDPDMAAALRAMGWEEDAAAAEASKPQPKAAAPKPSMKEQILARKKKALALKREGKIAEARAELAEAKKLEQQVVNSSTPPAVAKAPEPVFEEAEEKNEVTDEEEKVEVTDEDMRDPEMMAALRAMGFGDDEPAAQVAVAATKPYAAVDEFSLKQEILGIKRQALTLKREGRVDEARDTLRRAKVLEQQLEDLQAVSERQEETPALIKESRELRRVAQALPALAGPLNFGDEGDEEEDVEVENADLVDPEIAAALAAMGWQEDPSEKLQNEETPANLVVPPQILETKKVAAKEPEPAPIAATSDHVVLIKTKSQLQQELLGRKRRALALKREGNFEEARIELQEAKLIEQQIADLDRGLTPIPPPTVAEPKPVAAQPPPQQAFRKQEPEPSRPVYLDDLPVDEVEVTEDDMQDPSLRAALAGMGWQEENEEVAGPSKPIPVSEKSSRTGEKESQAQTGEKVKNLLEFDWGDPQWHAKKTGKEQDVKKDEEENPFEGEYGEIGQTMDLVPPLSGNNAEDGAANQRSPWSIFDRFQSKETSPTKESEAKKVLPPFPKPPERPAPMATATDATISAQPATPNLQQEILVLKRKALALKREGRAGEAREELRKAKLLERQQGAQPVASSTSTTTAAGRTSATVKEVAVVTPSPVPAKTSPQATKSPGHKEEMQKQVRQTKDRMKLQQESLAHKRKAMNLRREGKADEADAEYDLAKALEKQMEDLDPTHGREEDLGDVGGVDELLDPQLMAALKGLGFGEGELTGIATTSSSRPPPPSVRSSSRSSATVEVEKKQLEEQIQAQKMQAVQLKRAGKQAEALDKLRGAKQLEKRLLSLTF